MIHPTGDVREREIPNWFADLVRAAAAHKIGYHDLGPSPCGQDYEVCDALETAREEFTEEAYHNFRHLHPSSSPSGWIDVDDELPYQQDEEYFVRWRSDGKWLKGVAFYDNDAKEFYMINHDCSMEYMSTKEFKGLEWLKEPPITVDKGMNL
jgi:hypothetical protein